MELVSSVFWAEFMTGDPSKEIESIKVNGLDIKTLKGGFMAYYHLRSGRKRPAEEERRNPSPPPHAQPQYLFCKKCGTGINVYPPGRIARCCNQDMISIEEGTAPPASKDDVKEMESSGNAGP